MILLVVNQLYGEIDTLKKTQKENEQQREEQHRKILRDAERRIREDIKRKDQDRAAATVPKKEEQRAARREERKMRREIVQREPINEEMTEEGAFASTEEVDERQKKRPLRKIVVRNDEEHKDEERPGTGGGSAATLTTSPTGQQSHMHKHDEQKSAAKIERDGELGQSETKPQHHSSGGGEGVSGVSGSFGVKHREPSHQEEYCLEADCLFFGHGIEQNIEDAIYWYERSAEMGNSKAMLALGRIFEHGTGVRVQLEIAF